jgi:hypothetical protein
MPLLARRAGHRCESRWRGRASSIAWSLLLLPMAWAAGSAGAGSGGGAIAEYDLKAVFLFNFTRYVEWPARAFAAADAPVTICVLGADPFGQNLDAILEGERIGRRSVVARRVRDAGEVARCQILFIPRSESDQLRPILAELAGKSILTVGENERSERPSTMVRFVIAGNRVRLQVDDAAARAAGLTISSKLLRQAEIVRSQMEQ